MIHDELLDRLLAGCHSQSALGGDCLVEEPKREWRNEHRNSWVSSQDIQLIGKLSRHLELALIAILTKVLALRAIRRNLYKGGIIVPSTSIVDVTLSGLVGSIIGGALGALIPFILSVWREKTTFTLSLIAQFDSMEMYDARNKAWLLLKEHPNVHFDSPLIANAKYSSELWVLIGFFRTLDILIKRKRVHNPIVKDAFGQVFVWWYVFAFKENLVTITKWDFSEAIINLNSWFETNAGAETYARWTAIANADKPSAPPAPPPATAIAKLI